MEAYLKLSKIYSTLFFYFKNVTFFQFVDFSYYLIIVFKFFLHMTCLFACFILINFFFPSKEGNHKSVKKFFKEKVLSRYYLAALVQRMNEFQPNHVFKVNKQNQIEQTIKPGRGRSLIQIVLHPSPPLKFFIIERLFKKLFFCQLIERFLK